jgi:3-dehydroquinate synthase
MTQPIRVKAETGEYEAHVGVGLLDSLGELMRSVGLSGRVALVSDETVFAKWGEKALSSLRRAEFDAQPVTIAPGEGSKTLVGAEQLFGELIEGGFTRHDILVALGGGVVGDLGGFVAATFHRGMALVQVPTTLLAQVDSSIGGKVAVDHPLGKNLIGAFHAPALVVADVKTLATLPERERWSGMAEIVKAAFIRDAAFLDRLEKNLEQLCGEGAPASDLASVVHRAVEIKAEVVSEDEHETGARMWLNFGHTFGHALETATGYGPFTHGEAVVQGMRVALEISVKLGRLSELEAERAQAVLNRFPPPPRWPMLDREAVKAALFRDKKVRAGQLRFVVLNRLGEADIEPSLAPSLVDLGTELAVRAP